MVRAEDDFTSFHFSTETLPLQRRVPMWQEALERSVHGHRVISPVWDRRLHMDLAVHRLGHTQRDADGHAGIRVMRMTSNQAPSASARSL